MLCLVYISVGDVIPVVIDAHFAHDAANDADVSEVFVAV